MRGVQGELPLLGTLRINGFPLLHRRSLPKKLNADGPLDVAGIVTLAGGSRAPSRRRDGYSPVVQNWCTRASASSGLSLAMSSPVEDVVGGPAAASARGQLSPTVGSNERLDVRPRERVGRHAVRPARALRTLDEELTPRLVVLGEGKPKQPRRMCGPVRLHVELAPREEVGGVRARRARRAPH
jgi:hypothetical protein